MLVLPVLDILDGQVVHGIAGRRAEYRRIVSKLMAGSDPLEIAGAIRNMFGLYRFYVADLDGILKRQPNLSLYSRLIAAGFELLVDAGVRDADDIARMEGAGVTHIIVGLESCRSPDDLTRMAGTASRLTFSLDLLQGSPCRAKDSCGWSDDPCDIVRQAVRANATAILPLDLADVGMGTGGSTDALCRFIRNEFPKIGVITGGGVRGSEDLMRLRALDVDAALVATALHDGSLSRESIRALD